MDLQDFNRGNWNAYLPRNSIRRMGHPRTLDDADCWPLIRYLATIWRTADACICMHACMFNFAREKCGQHLQCFACLVSCFCLEIEMGLESSSSLCSSESVFAISETFHSLFFPRKEKEIFHSVVSRPNPSTRLTTNNPVPCFVLLIHTCTMRVPRGRPLASSMGGHISMTTSHFSGNN
jgi:hypothetical protein